MFVCTSALGAKMPSRKTACKSNCSASGKFQTVRALPILSIHAVLWKVIVDGRIGWTSHTLITARLSSIDVNDQWSRLLIVETMFDSVSIGDRLIGEKQREFKDFINDHLTSAGQAHIVIGSNFIICMM